MIGRVSTKQHFLVTGGAGFIGSHMVDFLLETYPASRVTCLDKLTYASNYSLKNLAQASKNESFQFRRVDLAEEYQIIQSILLKDSEYFDKITIFNFAAESCVDKSFQNPLFFTKNNILATQNLLEAVRLSIENNPILASKISLVHVSTDEVYGEQDTGISADESTKLEPSNPYAASKAACDLIIRAYVKSYNLKVNTVRANNVYGPRQYPEKLIASTLNLLQIANPSTGIAPDKRIIIHGNGKHRRRYLHVFDFVRAVDVIEKTTRASGDSGHTYNIGTEEEWSNKGLVEMTCSLYMKIVYRSEIQDFSLFYRFGKDRLYNDSRYSIDTRKICRLGWLPRFDLKTGIEEMILQMVHERPVK